MVHMLVGVSDKISWMFVPDHQVIYTGQSPGGAASSLGQVAMETAPSCQSCYLHIFSTFSFSFRSN